MGHLNLPQRIHWDNATEIEMFDGATKTYFDLKIGKDKFTFFEYKWSFPERLNFNFVSDGINKP